MLIQSFSTHTQKKIDATHERDSFQFSLEHCRAQIWQCRPFREATAFNCLHCIELIELIYIYKFNLYDLHVTPHNQTNTGISLCNFYKASPPQASTLHFSRHCKAEGKNHIQAKPVQGPARLQWELNPISCTAKLEVGVRFNNKAVCSTRRMS